MGINKNFKPKKHDLEAVGKKISEGFRTQRAPKIFASKKKTGGFMEKELGIRVV